VAIKGKGRTKSRRMVSAPPRPQIVTRKRPFLLRRSTWIVAGIVVLGAIGFWVWHVWNNHQQSQQLAKATSQLAAFRGQVDGALPADHSTPGGAEADTVFTTLPASLDKAGSGQLTPQAMRSQGTTVQDDAQKAAGKMAAIKTTSLIDGNLPFGTTTQMKTAGLTQLTANDAQQSMADALRLYAVAGGLLKSAADLPKGPKRTALITQAQSLVTTASSRFATGYNQMLQLEETVGNVVPGPPTVPGSTGLSG